MKIFHKDSDYAVRLLVHLALREGSGFVSATKLAGELDLPPNYLRRICSALIKAEYLETCEGAKGGVRLIVSPGDVTLLDLLELFHSTPELSECTIRKKHCPHRKTCVLRKRILGIEKVIAREFEAITIQSLIDDMKK